LERVAAVLTIRRQKFQRDLIFVGTKTVPGSRRFVETAVWPTIIFVGQIFGQTVNSFIISLLILDVFVPGNTY
jgi:hypothetical protein